MSNTPAHNPITHLHIHAHSNIGADQQLYDERDLVNCMSKIETIDFHQTEDVGGIKFTPYHAGHVLGAAMFMIEIAGVKVRPYDRVSLPVQLGCCSWIRTCVELTYIA